MEWNHAAETLYGWPRGEALGKNIIDVTPATMSRDHAAEIMQTLAEGQVWSGDFPLRTRDGESFVASVTDVPIVHDGVVAGVIGVSARSAGPASLNPSLLRFGAGCDSIWPDHVELMIRYPESFIRASEPHLLQLLSLIAFRYAAALDNGSTLDILAEPAKESLLSGFGIPPGPIAHVQIGTRGERTSASLLRDEISFADPANFAAALTRVLGGWIFVERDTATHLLVPVTQVRLSVGQAG